ncbi:MAG: FmdB family zinc ribbon protein, partial [Betaproteobacteria bacterium]
MPIYAYRCTACGHAKDVLQKISDPVLTTCPACQAEAFSKQVTAAGFQLKGSGWYFTDFRGDSGAGSGKAADAPAAPASSSSDGGSSGSSGSSGGGSTGSSGSSGSSGESGSGSGSGTSAA